RGPPPARGRAPRLQRGVGGGAGRGSGENGPGLRDRVDLAFFVLGRPEGGAVVESPPPVPLAVPGPLQGGGQSRGLLAIPLGPGAIAALLAQGRALRQHDVQEPAGPGAFAPALVPHAVPPVV